MPESNFCPNCGEPRPAGARFCPKCGQPFETAEPAETEPVASQAAPPPPESALISGIAGAALGVLVGSLFTWVVIESHLLFRNFIGLWMLSALGFGLITGGWAVMFAGRRSLTLQLVTAGIAALGFALSPHFLLNEGPVWRTLIFLPRIFLSLGIFGVGYVLLAALAAAAVSWAGWSSLLGTSSAETRT